MFKIFACTYRKLFYQNLTLICFGSSWWRKMENKCDYDCTFRFKHSFWNIFHNEHDFVDKEVIRCNSIFDTCGSVVSVVWNFRPSYFYRKLFWLQKNAIRASGKNQSDSETDTRTSHIHENPAVHTHGWHPSIRLHIHSTLLHSHFHLVTSAVLHVWFLVPSNSYTRHHMQ